MADKHAASAALREAQRQCGIAMSLINPFVRDGLWTGAWGEFQAVARLMAKTAEIANRVEQCERRIRRRENTDGR